MSLVVLFAILTAANALMSVLNLWAFSRSHQKANLVISIFCFGAMLIDLNCLVTYWN